MSTTYVVTLDLRTVGSLNMGLGPGGRGGPAALTAINRPMQLLKSGFRDLHDVGGRVMGVLDGAAHAAMRVAAAGLVAGGGAAFMAAYTGVAKLNAELQSSKIALATIFTANGQTNDLASGFALATDEINKMRVDAKKLPGELEDLKNIFVTTAIPGFEAGADADHMRQLSAKVMAFAAISRIPQDVAAREMAILLEGRSGAHNLLGMRLAALTGDKAKKFNQSSADKRLSFLEDQLDNYHDAVDVYSRSFEGVSSTLVDNVKQFGIVATGPLFTKVTDTLGGINKWFDDNEALVGSWADYVGAEAGHAFDVVKDKIVEWWPAIVTFFDNLRTEFSNLKTEWGPLFGELGGTIKSALADPETIQNIKSLIKGYVELKVAASGYNVLEGGVKLAAGGASIYSALSAAGIVGGGAAAGGAAAAAGGAAAGGGTLMGLLTAAPVAGTLAAALLAPVAVAGGLAAVAFSGVPDQESIHAADMTRGQEMAVKTLKRLHEQYGDGVSITEGVNRESAYLRANFQDTAADALELAAAMQDAGTAAAMYSSMLNGASRSNQWIGGMGGDPSGWDSDKDRNNPAYHFLPQVIESLKKDEVNKPKPKSPGGKGGTSIQKVEIVVTSNQHPSRVSRLVVDELVKLDRTARVSGYDRRPR
jgi:hypothetical protein